MRLLSRQPQAPVHILIIPKEEIATINDLDESNVNIISKMIIVAKKLASENNIEKDGYRLVMNCNEHGQQTVFHIHLHLIGGRQLQWPPG